MGTVQDIMIDVSNAKELRKHAKKLDFMKKQTYLNHKLQKYINKLMIYLRKTL